MFRRVSATRTVVSAATVSRLRAVPSVTASETGSSCANECGGLGVARRSMTTSAEQPTAAQQQEPSGTATPRPPHQQQQEHIGVIDNNYTHLPGGIVAHLKGHLPSASGAYYAEGEARGWSRREYSPQDLAWDSVTQLASSYVVLCVSCLDGPDPCQNEFASSTDTIFPNEATRRILLQLFPAVSGELRGFLQAPYVKVWRAESSLPNYIQQHPTTGGVGGHSQRSDYHPENGNGSHGNGDGHGSSSNSRRRDQRPPESPSACLGIAIDKRLFHISNSQSSRLSPAQRELQYMDQAERILAYFTQQGGVGMARVVSVPQVPNSSQLACPSSSGYLVQSAQESLIGQDGNLLKNCGLTSEDEKAFFTKLLPWLPITGDALPIEALLSCSDLQPNPTASRHTTDLRTLLRKVVSVPDHSPIHQFVEVNKRTAEIRRVKPPTSIDSAEVFSGESGNMNSTNGSGRSKFNYFYLHHIVLPILVRNQCRDDVEAGRGCSLELLANRLRMDNTKQSEVDLHQFLAAHPSWVSLRWTPCAPLDSTNSGETDSSAAPPRDGMQYHNLEPQTGRLTLKWTQGPGGVAVASTEPQGPAVSWRISVELNPQYAEQCVLANFYRLVVPVISSLQNMSTGLFRPNELYNALKYRASGRDDAHQAAGSSDDSSVKLRSSLEESPLTSYDHQLLDFFVCSSVAKIRCITAVLGDSFLSKSADFVYFFPVLRVPPTVSTALSGVDNSVHSTSALMMWPRVADTAETRSLLSTEPVKKMLKVWHQSESSHGHHGGKHLAVGIPTTPEWTERELLNLKPLHLLLRCFQLVERNERLHVRSGNQSVASVPLFDLGDAVHWHKASERTNNMKTQNFKAFLLRYPLHFDVFQNDQARWRVSIAAGATSDGLVDYINGNEKVVAEQTAAPLRPPDKCPSGTSSPASSGARTLPGIGAAPPAQEYITLGDCDAAAKIISLLCPKLVQLDTVLHAHPKPVEVTAPPFWMKVSVLTATHGFIKASRASKIAALMPEILDHEEIEEGLHAGFSKVTVPRVRISKKYIPPILKAMKKVFEDSQLTLSRLERKGNVRVAISQEVQDNVFKELVYPRVLSLPLTAKEWERGIPLATIAGLLLWKEYFKSSLGSMEKWIANGNSGSGYIPKVGSSAGSLSSGVGDRPYLWAGNNGEMLVKRHVKADYTAPSVATKTSSLPSLPTLPSMKVPPLPVAGGGAKSSSASSSLKTPPPLPSMSKLKPPPLPQVTPSSASSSSPSTPPPPAAPASLQDLEIGHGGGNGLPVYATTFEKLDAAHQTIDAIFTKILPFLCNQPEAKNGQGYVTIESVGRAVNWVAYKSTLGSLTKFLLAYDGLFFNYCPNGKLIKENSQRVSARLLYAKLVAPFIPVISETVINAHVQAVTFKRSAEGKTPHYSPDIPDCFPVLDGPDAAVPFNQLHDALSWPRYFHRNYGDFTGFLQRAAPVRGPKAPEILPVKLGKASEASVPVGIARVCNPSLGVTPIGGGQPPRQPEDNDADELLGTEDKVRLKMESALMGTNGFPEPFAEEWTRNLRTQKYFFDTQIHGKHSTTGKVVLPLRPDWLECLPRLPVCIDEVARVMGKETISSGHSRLGLCSGIELLEAIRGARNEKLYFEGDPQEEGHSKVPVGLMGIDGHLMVWRRKTRI